MCDMTDDEYIAMFYEAKKNAKEWLKEHPSPYPESPETYLALGYIKGLKDYSIVLDKIIEKKAEHLKHINNN